MVLQILFLTVITLLSFTVVAAGSSNDWLKPAHQALTVAPQRLQSYDLVEGDTEALDVWRSSWVFLVYGCIKSPEFKSWYCHGIGRSLS